MYLFKKIAVVLFLASSFIACQKNDKSKEVNNEVTLEKGIVSFKKTNTYLSVTSNYEEQQNLVASLKLQGFKPLSNKTPIPKLQTNGSITNISNTFDPSLYSDYLLRILNQDKICSINGYWIKVDMDNDFCTAIDAGLYPNEYNDLKNNVFTNNHIMVFLNANEPVLEVLSQIKDGTLTWQQYQNILPNKGGGGICLASGKNNQGDVKYRAYVNFQIVAQVWYRKAFIHFEMVAQGSTTSPAAPNDKPKVKIIGTYQYEGVCKGSGSGTILLGNFSLWRETYSVYSGGSPLKTTKIKSKTQAQYNFASGIIGETLYASIGY